MEGLTFGCVDGSSPYCNASTLQGFPGSPWNRFVCGVDRSASNYGATPLGRTGALSVKNLIGIRDSRIRGKYSRDTSGTRQVHEPVHPDGERLPASAGRQGIQAALPSRPEGGESDARVFILGPAAFHRLSTR
jgi:hypothetical protein